MKLGKQRKLKIKVGGRKVKVIHGAQDEDVKLLEKLDDELCLLNDVFKCLTEISKSLHPDCEKEIIIHLQCPGFFCSGKEFCKKVISCMESELTEKMQLKTRISRRGFIDYGR